MDDPVSRFPARRRDVLRCGASLGLIGAWPAAHAAGAPGLSGPGRELRVEPGRPAELVIDRMPFGLGGRAASALAINGTVPGPVLRLREGTEAVIRVTNRLDEDTSLHWHGLLVPSDMDGVPGISFPGIGPGETFTYRFPVRQSGTYWYHSHSGFQEQRGLYAPLVIDPAGRDPVEYDREHVVMLSDWTFQRPENIVPTLKKQADYYNFQQRTIADLFRDARDNGWSAALRDRLMWAQMRMNPADILDVTGYAYTYLLNGLPADPGWLGLFRPGERVRLRFVNGATSTFFNVRIPGLAMTVVQADGQNVRPVETDEFQIAVAETYDVIVRPTGDRAYTVFAESLDRSGFVRGTLAPRPGMTADVPPLRARPLRSMADMGMDIDMGGQAGDGSGSSAGLSTGAGMAMGAGTTMGAGMDHGAMKRGDAGATGGGHAGHGADASSSETTPMRGMDSPIVARHGPDTHGPANTMVAKVQRSRLAERGTGLEDVPHRVLTYAQLKSLEPSHDTRAPSREIEIHLTGNMEIYIWGIDGKKYSESPEPWRVRTGERLRMTMVNDTMMEHPMHIHGVFMELVNEDGPHKPFKHTVSVRPAERVSFDFTFDEPGNFAFHCHQLFHMESGMFRFFNVSGPVLWRQA